MRAPLCSAAQFLTVTRILHVCLSLNDYDDPPPDNDHSRANAPLPTVQAGLKQLIAAGVPPAKLVCGLPWYGYVYKLTKKGKVLVSAPSPPPSPRRLSAQPDKEAATGQRPAAVLANPRAAVERIVDVTLGRGVADTVLGRHGRRGRLAGGVVRQPEVAAAQGGHGEGARREIVRHVVHSTAPDYTLCGTIPKDFLSGTGRRTISTTANRGILAPDS